MTLNDLNTKLEIWGRAQREAARHHKSNWGTVKGLKFRSQKSHVAGRHLQKFCIVIYNVSQAQC